MSIIGRGGWRWREAVAIQALTGIGLVLAWSILALVASPNSPSIAVDEPPPDALVAAAKRVEASLLARSGGQCVGARDFEISMRGPLADASLTNWTMTRGPGILDNSCVAYGFFTGRHSISLVAALPTQVKIALQRVAEESYSRCLTSDQLSSSVESVLRANDQEGWEIRNSGLVGGPIDRLDAIVDHVKAGCFVYSGTGISAAGAREYYIVGPP